MHWLHRKLGLTPKTQLGAGNSSEPGSKYAETALRTQCMQGLFLTAKELSNESKSTDDMVANRARINQEREGEWSVAMVMVRVEIGGASRARELEIFWRGRQNSAVKGGGLAVQCPEKRASN